VAGYPLKISASSAILEDTEVNMAMLESVWDRLNWDCLTAACGTLTSLLGEGDVIPEPISETKPSIDELHNDEGLAENYWRWIMCVHVLEGALVCPGTGREFAIKEGIPNM